MRMFPATLAQSPFLVYLSYHIGRPLPTVFHCEAANSNRMGLDPLCQGVL
jgi:hypothetical protein